MGPMENAAAVKPAAMRRLVDRLNQPWLVLLAFAVFAYGALCLAARGISEKLLFPAPPPTYDARLSGLTMIPGEAGQRFAALYRPNPAAKHLLIFFHGNGEDLGSASGQVEDRVRHGFAVLAVDYPGYGLTGGAPSEAGLYASADAAYRHATTTLGWPKERIIVNGFSLGGAAAVWVASHEPVGGLILQSAFASAYRVKLDAPLVLGDRMPSLARMKSVRCPVLVIHGFEDGVIAWSHGRRLYDAAPEPKRCLWVPTANHCDVPEVAGENFWRAINEFAASLP